jgi:hypothetical protein
MVLPRTRTITGSMAMAESGSCASSEAAPERRRVAERSAAEEAVVVERGVFRFTIEAGEKGERTSGNIGDLGRAVARR